MLYILLVDKNVLQGIVNFFQQIKLWVFKTKTKFRELLKNENLKRYCLKFINISVYANLMVPFKH